MAWNDERLDELTSRVDSGFARVDGEIRDLRTEMREEFRAVRGEMRGEFGDVRGEMRSGFDGVNARFEGVNARIDVLHTMMFRLCVTIMVSMAGLIATLAAGALLG